jgi:hypothetical protein
MKFLTFKQLVSLIKTVGHKRTIVVRGEHGIGKTALWHAMKNDPFFADYIFPGIVDCAQLADGALFMYDIDREKGVSRELPNERFGISKHNELGINGARPVVICFDEIYKAKPYIQTQIAPILYDRRFGLHHLPEGSIVFGTSNLEVEGLGDSLAPHMRDRVINVQMRKPSQQEWKQNFALLNNLSPVVIAFTEIYPQVFESFLDYEPGGRLADKGGVAKNNGMIFNPRSVQNKWATPRSLHAASDIVTQYMAGGIDDDTLEVALDGTVGEVTRSNLTALIRYGQQMVSFERVLADPKHVPVADNANVQMVQVFSFITRVANRTEADAVVTYVERMRGEMQLLFCTEVAASNKTIHFVTNDRFAAMMVKQRVKFN